MKTEIKNLLKELVLYSSKTKKDVELKYLHKAIELEEEKGDTLWSVFTLMNWLDPIMLRLSDVDPYKMDLRGEEGVGHYVFIKRISNFFENCSELSLLFRLENETIFLTLS